MWTYRISRGRAANENFDLNINRNKAWRKNWKREQIWRRFFRRKGEQTEISADLGSAHWPNNNWIQAKDDGDDDNNNMNNKNQNE